jgi:hypothetical protein
MVDTPLFLSALIPQPNDWDVFAAVQYPILAADDDDDNDDEDARDDESNSSMDGRSLDVTYPADSGRPGVDITDARSWLDDAEC